MHAAQGRDPAPAQWGGRYGLLRTGWQARGSYLPAQGQACRPADLPGEGRGGGQLHTRGGTGRKLACWWQLRGTTRRSRSLYPPARVAHSGRWVGRGRRPAADTAREEPAPARGKWGGRRAGNGRERPADTAAADEPGGCGGLAARLRASPSHTQLLSAARGAQQLPGERTFWRRALRCGRAGRAAKKRPDDRPCSCPARGSALRSAEAASVATMFQRRCGRVAALWIGVDIRR